jgi:hypothetical protein
LRTARYRKGNGDVIFSYQVGTPPTIDGNLGEWTGPLYDVPYVVHAPDDHRHSRADLNGRFHIGWDGDHLYAAVDVTDDTHVQLGTGETIWQGDDVEIQIDADLSGDFSDSDLSSDDGQIGLSAGDFHSHRPEAYIWRPPHLEQPGTMVVVAAQQTGSGYTLEAAIPWWALGGRPPIETPVGFCLCLSDNDATGTAQQQTMISSAPTRKWGDPTTWGTLILVDWSWQT